jgi:hypothetical protein
MKNYIFCRQRAKVRALCRLLILVIFATSVFPFVTEAAEQVAIRGLIYISPSGKPEGDLVVYPTNLEVMLLRDADKLNAALESLRNTRTLTIEKQNQAVSRAQQEFLRAGSRREDQERKGVILRQERVKLAELREAYEKEVNALIEKFAVAKTKTESGGKFIFSGTPAGEYLVHAQYEILAMAIRYQWLVPVELKEGKETEVSLTKLNATPLF